MSLTRKVEQFNQAVLYGLRYLMHIFAAAHFWYAICYDFLYVYPPASHAAYDHFRSFGGKFRYLTILGAICQAIYFTLATVNDWFGTNEHHPKRPNSLRTLKDYMFAAFAFPLALNVAISFWGLMAIDRELVLPKSFDAFFPTWLNHVMHTNVAVFILIELVVTFRKYPVRGKAVKGLVIFNVLYVIWILVIKQVSGRWVYPVLDVLNLPQRIGFIAFMGVFGVSFYFVGEFLNNKIWASELRGGSKKPAKKLK